MRFVYQKCLYGRWTEVSPNGPMLVPNPEYAPALLGVEFKESSNEPLPKRPRGRAYKLATIPNGEPDAQA